MNKQIDITGIILTTPRLILRPWNETDIDDFYEYASVDGVGQMAGWSPHKNKEESQAILKSFIEGKKTFALEHQGKVIGSLGIERYKESDYPELNELAGREIGYVLSKAYWGKGLMPEAVKAVISYLFETVGLDFITVGHFEWNTRSKRVIEKCGFRYNKTVKFETRMGTVENVMDYILFRVHQHGNPLWEELLAEGFSAAEEEALVQEIYQRYEENTRLTKSKAARVEFLTSVKYIEKYLKAGAKILDIGAGTGEYSFYFAEQGYEVSALELAETNLAVFREKLSGSRFCLSDKTKDNAKQGTIDLVQGNALDLSRYADNSFDIVLLFGPLYHLHNEQDKLRCMAEAKRVCKPDGKLFFAFISNDIVILTMQQTVPDYLLTGAYNKETFLLDDFPFVFHTVEQCRELLRKSGIKICHEVASDGVSELLQETINKMDKETYEQYLRYHFYICEKPECLGMSNHLLFVGEAGKS